MQEEGRPPVNYRKSALWYVALAIIPLTLGLLAAQQDLDGNDFSGVFIIPALLIAIPQLVYSLVLSLSCLRRKAFRPAAWYFTMAFVGIAFAIIPPFLAEPLFMR
jgi:hypothetical protein